METKAKKYKLLKRYPGLPSSFEVGMELTITTDSIYCIGCKYYIKREDFEDTEFWQDVTKEVYYIRTLDKLDQSHYVIPAGSICKLILESEKTYIECPRIIYGKKEAKFIPKHIEITKEEYEFRHFGIWQVAETNKGSITCKNFYEQYIRDGIDLNDTITKVCINNEYYSVGDYVKINDETAPTSITYFLIAQGSGGHYYNQILRIGFSNGSIYGIVAVDTQLSITKVPFVETEDYFTVFEGTVYGALLNSSELRYSIVPLTVGSKQPSKNRKWFKDWNKALNYVISRTPLYSLWDIGTTDLAEKRNKLYDELIKYKPYGVNDKP